MTYDRVPTSAECYAVIRAAHPGLVAMTSFSDPDGQRTWRRGRMDTEWGFDGVPIPLVGISVTWDIVPDVTERRNEERRYWLCLPVEDPS